MAVVNLSKGTWIVSKAQKADTLLTRMIGWIGLEKVDPEAALWITPCWGIHTFGMHFPVDVIFLGKSGEAIKVLVNFPVNRVSPFVFSAKSVLILPGYATKRSNTAVGDRIEVGNSSISRWGERW